MDGLLLRKENLKRLLEAFEAYSPHNPSGQEESAVAGRMARKMPLAHSQSTDSIAKICQSRELVRSKYLWKTGKRSPPSFQTVEEILGTDECVFFYAAPFRYPETECGLLFKAEMEESHSSEACATPFDSGGSVRIYPPDAGTSQDYLRWHDLPVPDYRFLLEKALLLFFPSPWDYVTGTGPRLEYPLQPRGKGGNVRRWTFEVRVPNRVSIEACLEAVFLPLGRLEGPIGEFADWCEDRGIPVQFFSNLRSEMVQTFPGALAEGGFDILQKRCIEYLRGKFEGKEHGRTV